MSFSRFCAMVQAVEGTTKTTIKIQELSSYFREAPPPDKLWAVALFSGRRPKRAVSSPRLRQWASEATELPEWLVEESYTIVGDLAETLALLLGEGVEGSQEWSLEEVITFLKEVTLLPEPQQKEAITSVWKRLSTYEKFVFHKIITGGFRIGVARLLMVKALAAATNIPEGVVTHRLMGAWDPEQATFDSLFGEGDSYTSTHSQPYPFFLASPLEIDPKELGEPSQWFAEWKWDGIRGQLIHRGEEAFVWTRGEELVSDVFPELCAVALTLPIGTVLDGEILPGTPKEIHSFTTLQKRLGRKKVTQKVLQSTPVFFMAYDLLEFQGEDIRQRPLEERRTLLESLLSETAHYTVSPVVHFSSWEELSTLRANAREVNAEGFMLKRKISSYQIGRRRGDWWKWKVDPFTFDGVLLYAQRGHGRRAALYTDYTFGVWQEGKLVPCAKAYSGLTDKEIDEVHAWVIRNTLERYGPVNTVTPELVFEVAFEGIQRSSRHKSGIALRFPRILRWRKDKKKEEADTLSSLISLLPSEEQ